MNRVFLRALEIEDCDKIHQWRMDASIMAQTCGNVIFVSLARERIWVEEKSLNDQKDLYLAICLVESGEMIGYLSLLHIDWRNRMAEWGGLVIGRKDLWNAGHGTEAAHLMLDYAFQEMNLHRIYGYALEKHASSLRMIAKLGFKTEGILRGSVFKNNQYHNQVLISILRDEYENQIKKQDTVHQD
jgi:[ribosomal protein S5]-alanine N-acetyltransferase